MLGNTFCPTNCSKLAGDAELIHTFFKSAKLTRNKTRGIPANHFNARTLAVVQSREGGKGREKKREGGKGREKKRE